MTILGFYNYFPSQRADDADSKKISQKTAKMADGGKNKIVFTTLSIPAC